MRTRRFLFLSLVGMSVMLNHSMSQVGIGTTGPVNSSMLDVTSVTRGMLPPRMTAVQMNAIANPVLGLIVYCSDCNDGLGCLSVYSNHAVGGYYWSCYSAGCTSIPAAAGTITGTTPVHTGQNGVAYSIAAVTGATGYFWSYTGNGFTIASGTGTNSITANFSPSATSGDLTVTPTNECGNGTISPDFAISIIAVDPNCGGTYDYSHSVHAAGYTWLDRNLGASRVATAYNDYQAYGSLYQWGRRSDGHQCINWTSSSMGTPQNGTTYTQCSNGICPDALFVIGTDDPYDWNTPTNNTLWNGATKGANDPCPAGYRVPTYGELTALSNTFNPQNYNGAFSSPVKMVAAGARIYNVGIVSYAPSLGNYWSSTTMGDEFARNMIFYNNSNYMNINYRAHGMSVRCIVE